MKNTTILSLRASWPVLFSVFFLGACSSTPYKAPTLDTEHLSALPSVGAAEGLHSGAPTALWWTHLGDSQLVTLVQSAWQNNYDLRAAAARLTSAREQLQATQGGRWPDVTLEAGAGRTRLAEIESRRAATIVNPLQWQASMAWELDLFGRVRHSIEAAKASAEEQAAVRDDVRRLILAHLIEAYLDLRGAQMLSASLQQQLDNQADTLKLVRERESAGSAAPAERMRFEAQMRLVSSRLPSLLSQERAARNRIATLTGQRLDAPQLALLDRPISLQLPQSLVTDEPAQLLLRRPDVRVAERALAVTAAREGIAQAELFPRVSLSALLGNTGVAGDWLTGGSSRWGVGAGVSWSLFDGGTRRAQLRAAGADVQAARAHFDKVIAVALEETDTAISSWVQLRKRNAELSIAHGLAQESARLARIRYQEGAENLLGVLEAERIALAAEEQLVIAQTDLILSTARCYVAMAGGFDAGDIVISQLMTR